jgi:hypothetical protein
MVRHCLGANANGEPCQAQPVRGDGYCFWHSPATSQQRVSSRRRGGEGKSNVARASKRLPKDLRDVQTALMRALDAVESGALTPTQGQAMAALARAIVAIYSAASLEERVNRLEALAAAEHQTRRQAWRS